MEIFTNDLWNAMAVLVIDMQEKFITSEEEKRIIPKQLQILSLAKKKQVPIIVIKLINDIDFGPVIPEITEAIAGIPSHNLYKITKREDDAFDKTELDDILKSRKIKYPLVTGVRACECVFKTAAHGLDNGYEVVTGRNLIAGYCPQCSKEIMDYWYEQKCIMI